MGIFFEVETSIDLILQSLPDTWRGLIINYNLMNQDDTLGELLSILKKAEKELLKGNKREAHFASISQKPRAGPKTTGGVKKKKHKRKCKAKSSKASGKPKDKSQDVCLQCGKRGHGSVTVASTSHSRRRLKRARHRLQVCLLLK